MNLFSKWLLLLGFIHVTTILTTIILYASPKAKIVSVPGNILEHPWLVSIFVKTRLRFSCGGALIDPYWVVTSGHCVRHLNKTYWIRAGATKTNLYGVVIEVDAIMHFPRYKYLNTNESQHDVALLLLKSPLYHTEFAQLPQLEKHESSSEVITTLIGWTQLPPKKEKFTVNATLQKWGMLPLPMVHEAFEKTAMVVVNISQYTHLTNRSNVTGLLGLLVPGCNHINCFYIGSPAIQDKTLRGIVTAGNDCNNNISFLIATDVARYSNWIRHVLWNVECSSWNRSREINRFRKVVTKKL